MFKPMGMILEEQPGRNCDDFCRYLCRTLQVLLKGRNCKQKQTWTLEGVPNGWERVPLSNPLGFKHHPLKGAGICLFIGKKPWPFHPQEIFFTSPATSALKQAPYKHHFTTRWFTSCSSFFGVLLLFSGDFWRWLLEVIFGMRNPAL